MKSIKNHVIEWDRESSNIVVTHIDDYNKNERKFQYSWGACNTEISGFTTKDELTIYLFIHITIIIIRDRCDPVAVHNAMLELSEYVYELPEDMLEKIGM
jgi:hypothetical protein